MGYCRLLAGWALIAALTLTWPVAAAAQGRPSDVDNDVEPAPKVELDASRVEFSLGTYVGRPTGTLRVDENNVRGNRLRLNGDLGVRFSEAVDGSAAFHLTPRDGIRFSFLYYFLRGQGLLDRTVVYDGDQYRAPGHVNTNADFYRVSLAYERTTVIPGALLTGSVGLSYVHLYPELTSHPSIGASHTKAEDFYRQELPVPIVGLRVDIPMGGGFAARASIGGGGLPHIDSGRKEGGTVYLEQAHGDAAMAVIYALTKNLNLEIGPRATYFFQKEKSHEDDNRFELFDVGVRAGLTLKF